MKEFSFFTIFQRKRSTKCSRRLKVLYKIHYVIRNLIHSIVNCTQGIQKIKWVNNSYLGDILVVSIHENLLSGNVHQTSFNNDVENEQILPIKNYHQEKNISLVRIFYGHYFENMIDLKLPELEQSDEKDKDVRRIVTTIVENIKIIQDDIQAALTLINNFVVVKNHSEVKLNYLNGTSIIILDSHSQLYYYNLDNLEIIFSDMKINQFCWKAIHNSYLLNKLHFNKNTSNSVSLSLSESSFPIFCQQLSSIYGPVNINHTQFYSLFDYRISNNLIYYIIGKNFGRFMKNLCALNKEKELTYLNERINILNELKIKNFTNCHFLSSPLLGGNLIDYKLNDQYGLIVSSSSEYIRFWAITPSQYINIYNISMKLDRMNEMLKETILSTQAEERKQKLRKYIFVETDSVNWNIGVIQSKDIKVSDLVSFEMDIYNEQLIALDLAGNFIIYK